MNPSWKACCEVKENHVGSNGSLSIDRIMLFPVEIVHLIIVARNYYLYLDTVNGTNNLRDLTISKFDESNYCLCCFPFCFGKYYEVSSKTCLLFQKLFVLQQQIFFQVSSCQIPQGNSYHFL